MVIFPYQYENTWVFDDKTIGLEKEPFIAGIPDMIDILVKDIFNANKGFKLIFSINPFPYYQAELEMVREEYGGYWYRWKDREKEGWLCPAMFKYFDIPPQKIYCRAEQLPENNSFKN
jgi:hypothetical protein